MNARDTADHNREKARPQLGNRWRAKTISALFTKLLKHTTMNERTNNQQAPAFTQYDQLKAKHPDAIILVRCGDFYEMYGNDAEQMSKLLDLTLTRRRDTSYNSAVTGFPYRVLDTYLPKIIRAGYRVAICDPEPVETITPNHD